MTFQQEPRIQPPIQPPIQPSDLETFPFLQKLPPDLLQKCSFLRPEVDFTVNQDVPLLGKGGQGGVQLGNLIKSGQEVAIKTYILSDNKNKLSFMRELRGLWRWLKEGDQDRLAVEMYGYGVFQDDMKRLLGVIVMEFVKDGSLGSWMSFLTPKDKYHCLLMILRALEVMHQNSIVYRDLKPDNVLYIAGAVASVKLCDFGITRPLPPPEPSSSSSSTTQSAVMTLAAGTHGFMAPEMVSNAMGSYGLPVDIYAFGVLAFMVLVGRKPFYGSRKENDDIERNLKEALPAAWRDSLLRCLEFDSSERPTAKQLLDALETVEEDAVVEQIQQLVPLVRHLNTITIDEMMKRPDWSNGQYRFVGRLACDLPPSQTLIMRTAEVEGICQAIFTAMENTANPGGEEQVSNSSSDQAISSNLCRGVAICGMGGLGKSLLSTFVLTHLADQRHTNGNNMLEHWFPDGVFTTSFAENLSNCQLLKRQKELCTFLISSKQRSLDETMALQQHISNFSDLQEGAKIISVLSRGISFLLVVDNVWKASDISFLDTLSRNCFVLSTTRNADQFCSHRYTIWPLSFLSLDESRELLVKSSLQRESKFLASQKEAIFHIAKRCAGLPLLLVTIGSICGETSFQNISQQLLDADKLFSILGVKERCIYGLKMSIDSLEADEKRLVLSLAAIPKGVRIPIALISALWNRCKSSRHKHQDFNLLIKKLCDRSLLKTIPDNEYLVYIHDLTMEVIQTVNLRSFEDLHHSLYLVYLNQSSSLDIDPDGYFYSIYCRTAPQLMAITPPESRYFKRIDSFIQSGVPAPLKWPDRSHPLGAELLRRQSSSFSRYRLLYWIAPFELSESLSVGSPLSDLFRQTQIEHLLFDIRIHVQEIGVMLLGLISHPDDMTVTNYLMTMTKSPHPRLRGRALYAMIQRLPLDYRGNTLMSILSLAVLMQEDVDSFVRGTVVDVFSLLSYRSSPKENPSIFPLMQNLMLDCTSEVRLKAVYALGILVRNLQIRHENDFVKEYVNNSRFTLIKLTSDTDPTVQKAAVQVLAYLSEKGNQDVRDVFLSLTSHPDEDLRACVTRQLGVIAKRGDTDVITSLLRLTEDISKRVRKDAIDALGYVSEQDNILALSQVFPLTADADISLGVTISPLIDNSTPIQSSSAGDSILCQSACRLSTHRCLVVGPKGSGKSTFCRFLSQSAVKNIGSDFQVWEICSEAQRFQLIEAPSFFEIQQFPSNLRILSQVITYLDKLGGINQIFLVIDKVGMSILKSIDFMFQFLRFHGSLSSECMTTVIRNDPYSADENYCNIVRNTLEHDSMVLALSSSFLFVDLSSISQRVGSYKEAPSAEELTLTQDPVYRRFFDTFFANLATFGPLITFLTLEKVDSALLQFSRELGKLQRNLGKHEALTSIEKIQKSEQLIRESRQRLTVYAIRYLKWRKPASFPFSDLEVEIKPTKVNAAVKRGCLIM